MASTVRSTSVTGNGLLDLLELLHEGVVDVEAARRIDDDGVVPHLEGVFDGLFCRFRGSLRPLFKDFRLGLSAHHLKLVDGGGTVDVARDEEGALTLLPELKGELAAEGRLARALQAAHQDDGRRLGSDFELGVPRPHEGDELFVDDLDDLLGGIEGGEHLLPHRLFGDVRDELLGDL